MATAFIITSILYKNDKIKMSVVNTNKTKSYNFLCAGNNFYYLDKYVISTMEWILIDCF